MTFNQHPSQTSAFWQSEFRITEETIELLYRSFLEIGEPRSIEDVGLFFVRKAIEAEEQAIRTELQQGAVYQPDQTYQINDRLVFPRFDFAVGTVTATRAGFNPVDGEFTILDVKFKHLEQSISVAADLTSNHALSTTDTGDDTGEDGTTAAQKLFGQYQHIIRPKVEKALRNRNEFIEFNHMWFLEDMLIDIQEGLLNIVDAAIDINAGPLNVDILIEQLELQKDGTITETLRFSMNHRLSHDSRFINVGIEDSVLWYLNRLKPAEIDKTPAILKIGADMSFDINALNSEIRDLLADIDDEATPAEYAKPVDPSADEVGFVLPYPHKRAGTLPLLPSLKYLLPEVDGTRPMALTLVDGQTGDTMLAWFSGKHTYISGLKPWFEKYDLLSGAFITIKKTESPQKLVINFNPQRPQREWIRTATVKNDRLTFEMKNKSLGFEYNELMVLNEETEDAIRFLQEKYTREQTPLTELLPRIFQELKKLNSQNMVHTNTLYTAINVARRCPPGPLLQALINHPSFAWMGHGYWT